MGLSRFTTVDSSRFTALFYDDVSQHKDAMGHRFSKILEKVS